jgi:transcription antitermination factor NusG
MSSRRILITHNRRFWLRLSVERVSSPHVVVCCNASGAQLPSELCSRRIVPRNVMITGSVGSRVQPQKILGPVLAAVTVSRISLAACSEEIGFVRMSDGTAGDRFLSKSTGPCFRNDSNIQASDWPDPSTAAPAESQAWLAVYTTPRHEKRVAQHLRTREIEHFVALYRADRRWNDGSRVTLELPLFPGYVFVRIPMARRFRVLDIPGVLYIVGGTGKEPAMLPEADIEVLRNGLSQCRAAPHPYLTAGQRAIIRSGPLTGMEGIVVRTKSGCRVVLTLDLIRESIAVEVGSEDLEPLPSPGDHQWASTA